MLNFREKKQFNGKSQICFTDKKTQEFKTKTFCFGVNSALKKGKLKKIFFDLLGKQNISKVNIIKYPSKKKLISRQKLVIKLRSKNILSLATLVQFLQIAHANSSI